MSFKSLACVISVQCQEIKQALASISYFDGWDSDVVAECCRVSSVVEYDSETIILGSGIGTSHTVYFVLEGVCRMVQDLLVEVRTNSRRKTSLLRKLYRFLDSKAFDSASANEGYSSRLLNRNHLFSLYKTVKIPSRREGAAIEEVARLFSHSGRGEEGEEPEEPKPQPEREEGSKDQGKVDGGPLTENNRKQGEIPKNWNFEEEEKQDKDQTEGEEKQEKDQTEGEERQEEDQTEEREKEEKDGIEKPESESRRREITPPQESKPKEGSVPGPNRHLEVLEECKKRRKEATWVCKKGSLPEKPKNVERFFVQTGFLFKGACFGLEKHQEEHFIMSATKVKCLKIPRRFLLKHNPSYTWNRIGLFRSLRLPGDERILDSVRRNRKWIRKKENLSKEVASSRSIPNYTLVSDVPCSLRLGVVL